MLEPLINIDSGCNSKARQEAQTQGTDESATGKSLLRINLKERPANWPKPASGSSQNWLARTSPRVLQWYVLCGIPYRGTGATCLTLPYEPASFPQSGELPRNPGHSRSSTAHLQLSESITDPSRLQVCNLILPGHFVQPALLSMFPACFRLPMYCSASGCNFPRIATIGLERKRIRVEIGRLAVEMGRSEWLRLSVHAGLRESCYPGG